MTSSRCFARRAPRATSRSARERAAMRCRTRSARVADETSAERELGRQDDRRGTSSARIRMMEPVRLRYSASSPASQAAEPPAGGEGLAGHRQRVERERQERRHAAEQQQPRRATFVPRRLDAAAPEVVPADARRAPPAAGSRAKPSNWKRQLGEERADAAGEVHAARGWCPAWKNHAGSVGRVAGQRHEPQQRRGRTARRRRPRSTRRERARSLHTSDLHDHRKNQRPAAGPLADHPLQLHAHPSP